MKKTLRDPEIEFKSVWIIMGILSAIIIGGLLGAEILSMFFIIG